MCASAYEAHQVLRICIKVFEMRIQIRMAKITKCKMLLMVYLCYLKRQVKSFSQLLACNCIFSSVCLEVNIPSSEVSVSCYNTK